MKTVVLLYGTETEYISARLRFAADMHQKLICEMFADKLLPVLGSLQIKPGFRLALKNMENIYGYE